MTILFISNNTKFTRDEALKTFEPYTENNDFHHYYSLSKAKDFLLKNLITKNKHLDFIVADWNFAGRNSKELLNWLRNSTSIYSSSNFQIKSLPFLLIEDKQNQSATISDGFDGVIENFPNNTRDLKFKIGYCIKDWRTNIADDLELIGLDPKTQLSYSGHRKSFISYYKLKVLSREFVDEKSKLSNYIWTNPNTNHLEESNYAFEKKMKLNRNRPSKYLEKEFHDFFNENPTFIKGENFETPLYEKHLYINKSRKYNEPDFINKPLDHAIRNPEIFEVKRHTQRIIWKNKDKLLSHAKKSFKQVIRYKNYFETPNIYHQSQIEKYLGRIYKNYEYTLLLGSSEEKRFNQDLIEELKADFNFDEINLVTYDELLKKHIRLCDRLSEMNIL